MTTLREWVERNAQAHVYTNQETDESDESAKEPRRTASSSDSSNSAFVYARTAPAATPPHAPVGDAVHDLLHLLAAGAEPVLLAGKLYARGPGASSLAGMPLSARQRVAHLLAAIASGQVRRADLARPYVGPSTWTRKDGAGGRETVHAAADSATWRWPGTADAPAAWPGGAAFLLGVGRVVCATGCARYDATERACSRYGWLAEPRRAVRCLWAQPITPPAPVRGAPRPASRPQTRGDCNA
jgi:hypothetical protein